MKSYELLRETHLSACRKGHVYIHTYRYIYIYIYIIRYYKDYQLCCKGPRNTLEIWKSNCSKRLSQKRMVLIWCQLRRASGWQQERAEWNRSERRGACSGVNRTHARLVPILGVLGAAECCRIPSHGTAVREDRHRFMVTEEFSFSGSTVT